VKSRANSNGGFHAQDHDPGLVALGFAACLLAHPLARRASKTWWPLATGWTQPSPEAAAMWSRTRPGRLHESRLLLLPGRWQPRLFTRCARQGRPSRSMSTMIQMKCNRGAEGWCK
jgi:hypothetical protein